MELAPGDAVAGILMYAEDISDEEIAELRRMHNLDRPMIYRYGVYMRNLLRGDLGVGAVTRTPVWDEFIRRLPNTLILSFVSLIIGVGVAIPLGIIAARRATTLVDNSVTVFSMIGMSMPLFWIGILLMLIFAQRLQWLPAGNFDDGWRSLVLPGIVGSFTLMANAARQTRSNMLEVLKSDYLRTARAKGVPEEIVIRKHALNNAWIPIITAIGTSLSNVIAGAVVVEMVFTWPGIGRMAAEAVGSRDVTTATGVIIMTTIMYVLVQLIVDILYAFVDPRIKAQYKNYGRRRKKAAVPKKPEAVLAAPTESIKPEEALPPVSIETPPEPQTPEPVMPAAAKPERNRAVATGSKAARVSFATRTFDKDGLKSSDAEDEKDLSADDSILVSKKYKKRSQMGEIFHHMSKNKGAMAGLIIFGIMIILFIVSLFISWDSVVSISAQNRLASPSLALPFGADNMGRNVFLRVIYGTRYTLAIGLGAVTIAAIFGVTAGCIAGFYGGKLDNIILRISDVVASIPGMLLGMVIVTVLGQSFQNLIIAVGVQAVPIYLRMTRATTMTLRNNEFVEAAQAVGLSNVRIAFSQVLPNGLAPIIVTLTASLGISIIVASSLSFLGFGVPIPQPEWGAIIADGREFATRAPWLMTFPGVFIMLTVLAFNLLGDGLRDALDPKLKKR